MNVEAPSRAELLTLLSILEGELEARDVVIHALRVSRTLHLTHAISPCGLCHAHCRTPHVHFGAYVHELIKMEK